MCDVLQLDSPNLVTWPFCGCRTFHCCIALCFESAAVAGSPAPIWNDLLLYTGVRGNRYTRWLAALAQQAWQVHKRKYIPCWNHKLGCLKRILWQKKASSDWTWRSKSSSSSSCEYTQNACIYILLLRGSWPLCACLTGFKCYSEASVLLSMPWLLYMYCIHSPALLTDALTSPKAWLCVGRLGSVTLSPSPFCPRCYHSYSALLCTLCKL